MPVQASDSPTAPWTVCCSSPGGVDARTVWLRHADTRLGVQSERSGGRPPATRRGDGALGPLAGAKQAWGHPHHQSELYPEAGREPGVEVDSSAFMGQQGDPWPVALFPVRPHASSSVLPPARNSPGRGAASSMRTRKSQRLSTQPGQRARCGQPRLPCWALPSQPFPLPTETRSPGGKDEPQEAGEQEPGEQEPDQMVPCFPCWGGLGSASPWAEAPAR